MRHFNAPSLRFILEAQAALWQNRLHWDFANSARLLTQYLDSRSLTGFVALEEGHIAGYTFCVYEDTKAVIGDIFAMDGNLNGNAHRLYPAPAVEQTLMRHLFELLVNSPGVDRIESQLLLPPSGFHAQAFHDAGFNLFKRLFMVQSLDGRWAEPHINLPKELELRTWREEDLAQSAREEVEFMA